MFSGEVLNSFMKLFLPFLTNFHWQLAKIQEIPTIYESNVAWRSRNGKTALAHQVDLPKSGVEFDILDLLTIFNLSNPWAKEGQGGMGPRLKNSEVYFWGLTRAHQSPITQYQRCSHSQRLVWGNLSGLLVMFD